MAAPKALPYTQGLSLTPQAVQVAQVDPMLSWIGGLSTIAGIVALMGTQGRMGLRAVVIGIGMILLNQAIARYSDWLFWPAIIATGGISLTYGFLTIRRMVRHRKEQHVCRQTRQNKG
tara:strand:+ start:933 stop:1286 length:354 start_codon:yes stop_codon:yes gene_type:complete